MVVNTGKSESSPNVSLEERKELFLIIEKHVNTQLKRLRTSSEEIYSMDSRIKANEIENALSRLYFAAFPDAINDQASMFKNRWTKNVYIYHAYDHQLNPNEINKADFSTVDSMLDECFSIWRASGYRSQVSLRSALSISRDNFFNFSGSKWGSFFGSKTAALEQFENDISSDLAAKK